MKLSRSLLTCMVLTLALPLVFPWALPLAFAADAPDTSQPPTALVTGSDRGIGLALAQEFTARGWKVIATCRHPADATQLKAFAASHSSVVMETLDVTDNAAIDALAQKYRGQAIDALVNNAGIGGFSDKTQLAALDPDEFARFMRINAYAPLRVAQAFLDNIAASRQKKIVAISSTFGSLTLATRAQQNYFYAMSKSALNMGMRQLHADVAGRGIIVGIVSPGAVDTDMQKELRAYAAQRGAPIATPTLTPAESAKSLVNYIESLSAEQSGRFFNYKGEERPW